MALPKLHHAVADGGEEFPGHAVPEAFEASEHKDVKVRVDASILPQHHQPEGIAQMIGPEGPVDPRVTSVPAINGCVFEHVGKVHAYDLEVGQPLEMLQIAA